MENLTILEYGKMTDPLYVQYIRRKSHFDMKSDHFHSFYEIYYLISGQRLYFIKDTAYPIQAGDLVFIGKDELHKTLHLSEPFHERIVFHFDDFFIQSLAGGQSSILLNLFQQSSRVLRLPMEEHTHVFAHIRRIMEELQHKPIGYVLYLTQAIIDILLVSSRYLQKNEPVSISNASSIHKTIAEIVRYLNIHYAESINLSTISKQFFISPNYLSRRFKETTGFSFIDYLNLTRIREAQKLLRETDMKITDIAAKAGFGNFSHFGKTFKKITGISARSYRQKSS